MCGSSIRVAGALPVLELAAASFGENGSDVAIYVVCVQLKKS
jgi:hypothetical protein